MEEYIRYYTDFIIHIGLPLILFLLGLLVKQNRDAKVQVAENIDKLTSAIKGVEKELTNYQTRWMDRKETILDSFRKQCERAQGACRALVELQLEHLRGEHQTIIEEVGCNKDVCAEHWKNQDEFNKQLLKHIADTKLHNRK